MARTRMRSTGLLLAAVLLLLGATGASAQDRTTRWDSAIDGVIRDAWQATGECVRMIRVMRVEGPGVDQGTGVRALPIRPGTGSVIVCVTADTDIRAITPRDSAVAPTPEDLAVGRFVLVHHLGFFRPTNPPMVTARRIFVGRRDGSDAEPRGEGRHP